MDDEIVENFVSKVNQAAKLEDPDIKEEALEKVFEEVCGLSDKKQKVEVFNNLLVIKEHWHHKEILQGLQGLADPSSLIFIEEAFNQGFEHIDDYNGSGYAPIAKWFSHTLASIGTKEAVELIERFSNSENIEISTEMKYRLNNISA